MLSDTPVITVSWSKGKSISYTTHHCFFLILSRPRSTQKPLNKMVDLSTFILEKVKQMMKIISQGVAEKGRGKFWAFNDTRQSHALLRKLQSNVVWNGCTFTSQKVKWYFLKRKLISKICQGTYFSGGPVVKTLHFHCRACRLIPGRVTKIPRVPQGCSQKNKNKSLAELGLWPSGKHGSQDRSAPCSSVLSFPLFCIITY